MRPNPSIEELRNARHESNRREAKVLEEAGITRRERMDTIEAADRVDGVIMAFGKPESTLIHVRVEGVEAIVALRSEGFRVVDRDRDPDGTLVAIVDAAPRDEPQEEDDVDVECPDCGSDDVKEGVVPDPTRPMTTVDFGCRDCRNLWNDD